MYLSDHANHMSFAHEAHIEDLPSRFLMHDLSVVHHWLLQE
jgi:hypothetical protein